MFFRNILLLGLVVTHVAVLCSSNSFAFAQPSDLPDIEEDDSEVDLEEQQPDVTEGAVAGKEDLDMEEEESEDQPLKASPDGDTTFLFMQPAGLGLELPAGKEVHFLVGFANRGSKDFTIETLDASFRYPLDFTFHVQNFSVATFNRVVKPKQEVSLYYDFYTSETFSSRPFGLTVNLFYKDSDGTQYLDAVFNETVTIIEVDESLDGETFFLYVFLAACGVLLLVAAQQFLSSFTRRKIISTPKIEMGTANHQNDVDYDWLPKETLNELSKSPRRSTRLSPRKSPKQTTSKRSQQSPKQSPPPRLRTTKRGAGTRDE